MSKVGDTIYARSRVKAGLIAEEACELLGISGRQLSRYESAEEKTQPPSDIVDKMCDIYNDEYLGYMHIRKDPVARRFIPGGVERMPLLQSVVLFKHSMREIFGEMDVCELLALDGEISQEEEEKWLAIIDKMDKVVQARTAVNIADGADK